MSNIATVNRDPNNNDVLSKASQNQPSNNNNNNKYISCSPDLTPVHPSIKSIQQQQQQQQQYGGVSLLSSSLKSQTFNRDPPSLSSSYDEKQQQQHQYKGSNSLPQSFKSSTLNQTEVKNILSNQIESREKEIERLTRIAEKDKLDSINYLNHIKEHKETLVGYINDFYADDENGNDRKEHIEKSTVLNAIEGTVPTSPFLANSPVAYLHSPRISNTPTSIPSPIQEKSENQEVIQSISFWDTAPTQQQHEDGKDLNKESVSKLVSSFHTKDEELERVRSRTSTESMKAQYLREKYEVLTQLVQNEKENWSAEIDKLRKEVQIKEKDICRLLMVAETQKKSSMEYIDQITKLKRSLSSISQLRGNSCLVDIHRMNERFSFESLSSSPTPSSLGSYGSSGNGHYQHSLTNSPHQIKSNHSSPNQSPKQDLPTDKTLTEEKKEIISLRKSISRKDDEIKRIKEIIEYELMKTNFLCNKVTELKTMLEDESRQVDSLQLKSYKEMKEKEEAIQKVAMRALKERMKADHLREEIKKLSKELKGDDYKKKNYDVAAFTEMGDLSQFQNLSLSPYCNEQTPLKPQKPKITNNTSILNNVNNNYINNFNNNVNNNNNNGNNNNNYIQNNNINNMNQLQQSMNIPTARSSSPTPDSHQRLSHTSSSIKIPNISRRNSVTFSPSPGFTHQHNRSNSSQIHHQSSQQVIVGSPTEIINMKLQEIERNCKVAGQKDAELAKIKKIAEAERSRFTLLKEKYLELKSDLMMESDSPHGLCGKYTTKIY